MNGLANGFALLAPGALLLGVGVAAALAILHAITVGRPRPAWLPTARFAPDRAPRAARRLARPADRWLLALRMLAALLAAAALARPVRDPARRRVARIVLADLSQPAARAAVRDSVRALVENGDALVPFAGTPRPALLPATPASPPPTHRAALDSTLTAATRTFGADVRPSLSAALVAARRTAPALAATADSIEVVVVSPLARELVDPATIAVRSTWHGRVRMVSVGAARTPPGTPLPRQRALPSAASRQVTLRGGPPDDALAAAVALAGIATAEAAPIRVVRSAPSPADSTWASESSHVLVIWPAIAAVTRRATPDAAEALAIGDRVAAGAFGRIPATVAAPTLSRAPREPSRTLARWSDGAPVAVEQGLGRGCVRIVTVRVPQTGDAALRPSFVALLPSLLGPCGIARDTAPLAAEDVARLAGTGPLLAAAPLRAPHSANSRDPIGATLLALAAALLLFELPLRRITRRAPRSDDATADAGHAASPEPGDATAPRVAA